MNHETTQAQDDQKEPKDPATNPRPPRNPEVDEEAMRRGEESLDRVKPY